LRYESNGISIINIISFQWRKKGREEMGRKDGKEREGRGEEGRAGESEPS
jgi:hypothetical protein